MNSQVEKQTIESKEPINIVVLGFEVTIENSDLKMDFDELAADYVERNFINI